jgi:hypothetical protein
MDRLCDGCGEPLSGTGRSDRRHHNATCRKRAYLARERPAPELHEPAPPAHQLDAQSVLAEALSEPRLVASVAKAAAMGQWRAAAWLLERRHPERWGARTREVEPAVSPDPFAEVDELAARRRLLHPVTH